MEEESCILVISALDLWSMGRKRGAQSLWMTLKGYADRGWQVYFITGNRAQGNPPSLPNNVHVVRFDALWLKRLIQIRKLGFFFKIVWWSWFQSMAFINAQRIHAKHKFDVVYGYEIHGVPVANALSKLWHVPVVSRFQGTILGEWMKRRGWRLRAWDHILALKVRTDLVIMANDGTQGDRVLHRLGVNRERTRFWMNGIDWELFASLPEKAGARCQLRINAQRVLLTVSRLESWKRIERSIQALPDVVKYYPDTVFVIVGNGSERERLECLAHELGVAQHVRFEGAVPHDEVPKYLAAADIFLSFYDWSNVGNPLLEAMMAGKCIVTLNNGDTSRFVKNEQNGVLLEYEDLPKLPEVIKRLLADEGHRKRLGASARRFAEKHFWSWEERMDAEVQAVEALLS